MAYEDRAHLEADVAAARDVAAGLFTSLAVGPPDHQQALDALAALWTWLDTIEQNAGALLP